LTSWWSKAWSWFTVGKRWLILPAILAGVVALVGCLRGRRAVAPPSPGSVPGGGPVGEEAEEIRQTIRETAEGETAEIKAAAESDRERIRRALGKSVLK
jgi:hypothetical protein